VLRVLPACFQIFIGFDNFLDKSMPDNIVFGKKDDVNTIYALEDIFGFNQP